MSPFETISPYLWSPILENFTLSDSNHRLSLREGFKKIVKFSTKGLPPTAYWKKLLLALNDLHVMRRILFDNGR